MRMQIYTTVDKGGRKLYDQLETNPLSLGRLLLSPRQLLMMKNVTWNIRGLKGRFKKRIL